MVKNLPAMQETQAQSLGWKSLLEQRMPTHSNILAWRIPWTEEPGSPWDFKESDTNERLTFSLYFFTIFKTAYTLQNCMWGYH